MLTTSEDDNGWDNRASSAVVSGGCQWIIYSSNSNLALANFDNRVTSFIITGGTWELYSGASYTGSMVTHGQGLYPTPFFLKPIVNDDLTSMRLKIFGKKGFYVFIILLDDLRNKTGSIA